jgi:hypothetical protein
MEFLDENDCSGIASIGPIVYSTFLQFQPTQLILLYSAVAIAALSQFCWCLPEMSVRSQPHQTAPATTTTQQPTFPMEFLGGNDCSGVALISPVMCVSFSQFQPLLLCFLNKWTMHVCFLTA